jgi:hypothetical protein
VRPAPAATPLADGRLPSNPIVRYYWAQFLEKHRADIRGRGLRAGATDMDMDTIRHYGESALTHWFTKHLVYDSIRPSTCAASSRHLLMSTAATRGKALIVVTRMRPGRPPRPALLVSDHH